MSLLISILRFVLDFFIYILIIRMLLQKVAANYFNQISQFVIKLTDPVVKPLQRFLPGYKGFDFAIIALFFILQIIEVYLLFGLGGYPLSNVSGILLIVIGELGTKIVSIYFFSTIILGVASWFPALQTGPVAEIVHILCDPLLRRFRNFIPTFAGLDFSLMALILLLLAINYFIFNPVIGMGFSLLISSGVQ
jgi:YggT family protein